MLLDTENISFAKFLMHFQPFKGPKFQNCFHVHVILSDSIKHASLTPFITCTFTPLSIPDEPFPIWTGYSENELGVSHIF